MSVFTALQLPQVFGRALSQSGAFVEWGHEPVIMQIVRHFPRPQVRLWLDCGCLDSLLDANRAMRALLVYQKNGGAHNFTTWRDSCAHGLEDRART